MTTREGATQEDEGDFIEHLFTATTHDYLMFFTESGRCYVERVYEIPEMGRASKGRTIANLLELRAGEKIAATIRIQSKRSGTGPNEVDETWDENLHIVFATRTGIVKKSNLSDFSNVRKGGIIAIKIEEDDRLIDAVLTNGDNEIVLITPEGMSIRFHEDELRDQGRNTVGVWGIRPEKGDHVVGDRPREQRRDAPRRRRKRHRQTHGVRRLPHPDARRQRHHHDEDRRQDRPRRRRADRDREGRAHAHHDQRPNGPDTRLGDSRRRSKHHGRETDGPARSRKATGDRAGR